MASEDILAAGEESLEVLHPHWKILVRPVVSAVLVLMVVVAIEVILPYSAAANIARLVIGGLAIILLMWWLMIPILRWRTTTYELTNRRMRIRTGIIVRTGKDFPLSRIVNISYRTGLLDRIFGSGTVVLETAGEHGDLTLDEIPRVRHVQSLLFQLLEDGEEENLDEEESEL
jgi:uncharacterized membrane protein YdbT with pleckstrin-like domain